MKLNLGAGKKLKQGWINVDVMPYDGIDCVEDLSRFPWCWGNESVEEIYASHVIEHFPDQKQFIDECLRVLAHGGKLTIVAPHSSCITSIGCMGHYRTYHLTTFNDYLAKPFYMFKTARFRTISQKINWWYEVAGDNVPKWLDRALRAVSAVLSPIINASPQVFENWWWVYVGGAREIVWKGEKV